MAPDHPLPPLGGEAGPRDARERERLEALGGLTADLLNDLSYAVNALEARARLAAGEARAGRVPLGSLETLAESGAELGAMLRDAVEALRGETISPEVTFAVQPVVEQAARRLLTLTRPVVVRVSCDLPGDTAVRGRASFLSRAVGALLEQAARHARGTVRVTLATEPPADGEGGGEQVVVRVEHDGAPRPERAAGRDVPPVPGWLVAQLGGELCAAPSGGPNSATAMEIRLSTAPPAS